MTWSKKDKCFCLFNCVILAFGLWLVNRVGAQERQWRISPSRPLPLAQQYVGHQFYAALAIPEAIRSKLNELAQEVNELAETRPGDDAPMEERLSSSFFFVAQTMGFDDLRAQASDYCGKYRNAIASDPCTHVRFSPFEMVCELTVVVTQKCDAERHRQPPSASYDQVIERLVSGELQFPAGSGEDVPLPKEKLQNRFHSKPLKKAVAAAA